VLSTPVNAVAAGDVAFEFESLKQEVSSPQGCESPENLRLAMMHEKKGLVEIEAIEEAPLALSWARCLSLTVLLGCVYS